MPNCRWWRDDSDDHGRSYEYCRAKGEVCSCSGVLMQCDYPMYFNIPAHRVQTQRLKDMNNNAMAKARVG